jgi:hypothetical protein
MLSGQALNLGVFNSPVPLCAKASAEINRLKLGLLQAGANWETFKTRPNCLHDAARSLFICYNSGIMSESPAGNATHE